MDLMFIIYTGMTIVHCCHPVTKCFDIDVQFVSHVVAVLWPMVGGGGGPFVSCEIKCQCVWLLLLSAAGSHRADAGGWSGC